jgi:hypothetical protein
MASYIFTPRTSVDSGPIFTIEKDTLEEATNHFARMKQLSEEEFLKLFIVTEIKKGTPPTIPVKRLFKKRLK